MLQSALNKHESHDTHLMARLMAGNSERRLLMNPGLGWLTLRFYLNYIVLVVPWRVILAGFLKTLLLHHDLDAGLSLKSYYTQQ